MLHDSINKLGEAIKKDEEYAQETRRQLDDIRSRLNGIMTQKSVTESSSTPHPAKKKTSSVLNGMKIMSMETGMAGFAGRVVHGLSEKVRRWAMW